MIRDGPDGPDGPDTFASGLDVSCYYSVVFPIHLAISDEPPDASYQRVPLSDYRRAK